MQIESTGTLHSIFEVTALRCSVLAVHTCLLSFSTNGQVGTSHVVSPVL